MVKNKFINKIVNQKNGKLFFSFDITLTKLLVFPYQKC